MSERKILFEFETTEADGTDNVAADVMARYVIYEDPEAMSGLIVIGWTIDGREIINPWSPRPVIRRLLTEIEKYKIALADAIRCPMGVCPDSAQGLVSEKDLHKAEDRRSNKKGI